MKLVPGSRIDIYEVLAPIGKGGMGEVYRARDTQLGRDAAIKVLPEHISSQSEALARLENEARLASSLNHPNIVTIYAIGWEGPRRYIAMEFIEGSTLQDLIETGPLPVDQAVHIAAQLADGLAKAHEAGIIHRDLKPKNVMLTKDGIVKILDFGLSKLTPSIPDSEARTPTFVDAADGITKPGTILGTVEYMSPEQAVGRPADFRSDQFSMGSLMYAILTGKKPFHRDSAVQTLSCIIERDPQPVSQVNPLVPQPLEAVIRRCMRKDPGGRYPSTGELARELHALDAGKEVRIPRWTRREWIRASLILCALLGAALMLWVLASRPYKPVPEALEWYQKGMAAMHSMTFEAARKAFEQSVTADPKFALAHAGLARAYDELDYSEKAKESMLHALAAARETRISNLDESRLRALNLMVTRDYDQAFPLLRQIEREVDDGEKPAAALELGWLAQQREDTEGAAEAYERALQMNPRYAAARFRLGYIQQRRGEDDLALKSFDEAESLYVAASDLEGVTETLYQRANLLNRRSRAAEAIPVIDKAIAVAQTVGSRYQIIRLEILKASAARKLGQGERSSELAQQAIDAAVAEKMDNLATSAMIALGNSFFVRRDYEPAEKHFRSALDIARRGKVRRYEAQASLSLASLCEQENRPEEARQFVKAALSFYSQAGYRRELVQSKTVLGGILDQQGEFEQGTKVLRQALPDAVKLGDRATELQLRERLIDILQDQGAWPEALRECEQAAPRYAPGQDHAWGLLHCSGLYWKLGRRQDAGRCLSTVEELLKTTRDTELLSSLRLRQAEIAYSEGNFEKAKTYARMAGTTGAEDQDRDAELIHALALIRTSRHDRDVQPAVRIVQKLDKAKLIGKAAFARLAIAEAIAGAGMHDIGQNLALEAFPFFEQREIWESLWRGNIAVARAPLSPADVESHKESARSALVQLRKAWPAGSVDVYLTRPDIKLIYRNLEH